MTVETETLVDSPLWTPIAPPDTAAPRVAAGPHEATNDPGPAVTHIAMDETMIRDTVGGLTTIGEGILITRDRAFPTMTSTALRQGVRSTITKIETARSENTTEDVTEIVEMTIETGIPGSASDTTVLSDLGMPISRDMTPPPGTGAPVQNPHLVYDTKTVDRQTRPILLQLRPGKDAFRELL